MSNLLIRQIQASRFANQLAGKQLRGATGIDKRVKEREIYRTHLEIKRAEAWLRMCGIEIDSQPTS